jgi:hypothetical protein
MGFLKWCTRSTRDGIVDNIQENNHAAIPTAPGGSSLGSIK